MNSPLNEDLFDEDMSAEEVNEEMDYREREEEMLEGDPEIPF